MIDCARPVVGSARASSFRKRAEKSHVGLTPNATPASSPNAALPIGYALCKMVDASLKMNRL
jgi:hypothetical protein